MSPLTASLAVGELGFADRLTTDATMQSLLGVDADGEWPVYNEWIGDRVLASIREDDQFRAIGFFRARPGRRWPAELRIQSDLWVSQTFGGSLSAAKARLEAIDARMLDLIHEQQWTYDGVTLNGLHMGERDVIGGHLRPLRRMREWSLGVG